MVPPNMARRLGPLGFMLLFTLALANFSGRIAEKTGWSWFQSWPTEWSRSPADSISRSTKWLVNDATFGIFTFTELTRGFAYLIEKPYSWALAILSDGFMDGVGRRAEQIIPPLTWLAVILIVALVARRAGGWKLTTTTALLFAYLAIFGQWNSAMITLASMVIAVPLGVLSGLAIGLGAYRSQRFEQTTTPILDLMQTIPTFAYLVPILFFFGFGPVAALVATIIYAMPPMARNTTLALRGVSSDVYDFGKMIGCSQRQMTWRVLIPSAKSGLMIGVNQVIMLSLNMVIIASMIGAGGLGFDVLESLRRLDIGRGLEAGIAIVVLAVALDRISQAYAEKQPTQTQPKPNHNFLKRWPTASLIVFLIIATGLVGFVIESVQTFPESAQVSTAPFWDWLISWINLNFFDALESFKVFFLQTFMLPLKRFLAAVPWWWWITTIGFAGWRLGRERLSLLVVSLSVFVLVVGLWDVAIYTIYLCASAVVVAMIIGVPLGVLAAEHPRFGRAVGLVIDTLQTLPSFVYLIPVVMLFRVGDFTAFIAVVLYALAPAVRYTWFGIRELDDQIIEAATVSGCTRRQLLTRVKLPLALPEILLGLNQTIMLALSMLVITALVGTRDLGQEVYIALTKANTGRGIVAGLSIAAIAIIADRLIGAAAKGARERYGINR
jgi:glycine betaine/proline transport system permease protein